MVVMAFQCAALYLLRNDWSILFETGPTSTVSEGVAPLLGWVMIFLFADGTKDALSGVITGAYSTAKCA